MRKLILCISFLLMLTACEQQPETTPFVSTNIQDSANSKVPATSTPAPTLQDTKPPASTPTPVPVLPSATPSPAATATFTSTQTPTATLVFHQAGDYPVNVNPLTGMTVEDSAILSQPPVSVKINNYPRNNRPQWGLSQADIVFEYYHNNWLPRFHAIFYGEEADLIGPIRSGRLFDRYLVESFSSIFAFGGADWRILYNLQSSIPEQLLFGVEAPCPPEPLCRYYPQGANYLVGGTAAIRNWAVEQGLKTDPPDLHGFAFGEQPPTDGEAASNLIVRYSLSAYTKWEYEPQTGNYWRYQDTKEAYEIWEEGFSLLVDKNTDEPIQAENVVVLFIDHSRPFYKAASDIEPAAEIVEIEMVGSGEAVLFRDGLAYRLQWIREEDDMIIRLVNSDGEDFPLKPGKTWFEVISLVTITSTDTEYWRFDFRFPAGD